MNKPVGLNHLKSREEKCWKSLDWFLSPANKDLLTKLKATEFVLKRLYPEKTIIGGEGDNGEFIVKVEISKVEISNENNITSEPRNRIQQYFEV